MCILKNTCFIYFIWLSLSLCVNSDNEVKVSGKYNSDDDNDEKTCNVEWSSSWSFPEPYFTCWSVCKLRCIATCSTSQWHCKKSALGFLGKCECCKGEL